MNMENIEKLIKQYDRYIQLRANAYGQTQTDIIEDLLQIGKIAVFEACESYNPNKNGTLQTWIFKMVDFEMMDYLNKNARTIRYPNNFIYSKDNQLKEKYSVKTISQELPAFSSANQEYDDVFIKDQLVDDTAHLDIIEGIEPDTPLIKLRMALNSLKLKDKELIEMYYGINRDEPMSFEEIGKFYGTTKQNIHLKFKRISNELKLILK